MRKFIGVDQSVRHSGHIKTFMKDKYILSVCGGCESCSYRYDYNIFHWFIRVGKRCHNAQYFGVTNGYTVPACSIGVGMALGFCSYVECFYCQFFFKCQ